MAKLGKNNWGKSLIVGAAITAVSGLTYLGEKVQPFASIKEAVQFHNVGPAPTTPENYKTWHVVIEKNENLDAIVKITDDSTTYILDKNLGPVTAEQQQEYLSIVGKTAADGTPKEFLEADIAYKVNSDGQVELYFGNKKTRQYWQVNENWTAGDIGQQVDKFFEKMMKGKKWTVDKEQQIKEKAIDGWNKTDSLYSEKKEDLLEKKEYITADSTKQNFWQNMKENSSETYQNIKKRFEKK